MVIRAPKPNATSNPSSASESASAPSPGSQAEARPTAASQANPAGAFPFGLGAFPGMGNLNFANTNFGDIQQQFQQQVISIQMTAEFKCLLAFVFE